MWWRSSTRASYRTRLGCYVCDLQPSHGLSATVTALLFAIISFRSLFSSCSDLESNLIFRLWECGIQEQLSSLSHIAAFTVSRCWMSFGSEEERWTANFLSGILAVRPCWHLTNDETSRKMKLRHAIYATSQQRLRWGLRTVNVSSKLSVNDLQAKDSSLEDGRNVSEKQTNVLQSVHTKTKNKPKKAWNKYLVPTGL